LIPFFAISSPVAVAKSHFRFEFANSNGNISISDLEDDDAWNDPTEWPKDIRKEKLKVSRLTQQKIMRDYDEETKKLFKEQEWKQLDRYHKVGIFGEPIH